MLTIINGSIKVPHQSSRRPAFEGLSVVAPTFAFQGSHWERRAFELFRTRIVFQLSGDFDGWFWNTLLLRATHREAAVRHAVLALSSLCEQNGVTDEASTHSSPPLPREGPLALQQYNHAIAELTTAASNHQLSLDVCLITCMLFSFFEVVRGHHGSAMSHISSGVKILSEVQSDSIGAKSSSNLKVTAIPYVDLESFQVIFNRLNLQASQIAGFPPMQIRSTNTPPYALGFAPEIPHAFRSIEEACNSLEYHFTQCTRLFAAVGQYPSSKQLVVPRIYIDILGAWQSALQAFVDNAGDSLSATGKQAARVMQLNRIFLGSNIIVATSENPLNDMHWDNRLEEFKQMMLLAREIVEQSESDLRKDPRNLHRFSMGMNIIAPLYVAASSCRDPLLRREAVTLLQRSHNQQGLWDARIAGRVCSKLIEIEEKGLGQVTRCEDVPESARVSGVKVIFDSEGRLGAIAYRRKPEGYESKARDYKDLITILEDDVDTGVGYTEAVRVQSLDAGEIREKL